MINFHNVIGFRVMPVEIDKIVKLDDAPRPIIAMKYNEHSPDEPFWNVEAIFPDEKGQISEDSEVFEVCECEQKDMAELIAELLEIHRQVVVSAGPHWTGM